MGRGVLGRNGRWRRPFCAEQANRFFVLMMQRSVFGRRFSLFSKCCTSNTKSGAQRGCKVEAAGRKGAQKARLPCGEVGLFAGGSISGASVLIADACGSRIKVPTERAAVGERGEEKEAFVCSVRRNFAGDEDVGFDPAELVGVHLVEAARVAGVESGVA